MTEVKCIYSSANCSKEKLCLGCWSEHMSKEFPGYAWND